MGLRSFFRRRQTAAGDTAVSTAVDNPELLAPEQLAELQEAWAELAQAAKGSGVTSLHACSRNGRPWEEDPAAVRGMAAILRGHSADMAE